MRHLLVHVSAAAASFPGQARASHLVCVYVVPVLDAVVCVGVTLLTTEDGRATVGFLPQT